MYIYFWHVTINLFSYEINYNVGTDMFNSVIRSQYSIKFQIKTKNCIQQLFIRVKDKPNYFLKLIPLLNDVDWIQLITLRQIIKQITSNLNNIKFIHNMYKLCHPKDIGLNNFFKQVILQRKSYLCF